MKKKQTQVKLRLTAKKYSDLVGKMLENNSKHSCYFDYEIKLDHKGGYMALYEIDVYENARKNGGKVDLGE